MPKYTAYIRQKVRKVIAYRELDVETAIKFLKENKFGVIFQDDTELTLEELEYVKSLGSETRTEPDNTLASGGKVFKDTDRELSWSDKHNSKSSTDSDN